MHYQKAQSVAKTVQPRGVELERITGHTLETISSVVGSTLGPGGRQVLLERQEHGVPPMLTKDGVTVFRSLGFRDPRAQALFEATLDASIRTANEAGDGTTTTAILNESIARFTNVYTKTHPSTSPQKVIRELEQIFRDAIEPGLKADSSLPVFKTKEGKDKLLKIAKLSANGDEPLAQAVMQCFEAVGDAGNVTIAEVNGHSKYEVERIEGYPINVGYEDCGKVFYSKFINDVANQRCLLETPTFVLYHGRLHDPQNLVKLLRLLGEKMEEGEITQNVVIAATGFSETVIGWLATMFAEPRALHVFPLQVPVFGYANGQMDFLMDISAVTGATVLDQLNNPIENATVDDCGDAAYFESFRFRSTIVASVDSEGNFVHADEVSLRADELETNIARAESQQDMMMMQERLGKLTGGIARLKVVGSSAGELKEKRDRAEDAVCAVRGAVKNGYLPGGGWGLVRAVNHARVWAAATNSSLSKAVVEEILAPALEEPLRRLYGNLGYSPQETSDFIHKMNENAKKNVKYVYDCSELTFSHAELAGVLDSAPAVIEAIRNSISIAGFVGTLGGIVVFNRNSAVEAQEAKDAADYERNKDYNPADEHW